MKRRLRRFGVVVELEPITRFLEGVANTVENEFLLIFFFFLGNRCVFLEKQEKGKRRGDVYICICMNLY